MTLLFVDVHFGNYNGWIFHNYGKGIYVLQFISEHNTTNFVHRKAPTVMSRAVLNDSVFCTSHVLISFVTTLASKKPACEVPEADAMC